MKSSITTFIQDVILSRPCQGARSRHHVLLLFDASGCVRKADLAILKLMVTHLVSTMCIDVSLTCVNHDGRFVTPYCPTDAEWHPQTDGEAMARCIDMFEILVECLSDEHDDYDGIVVMTEGEFPFFSVASIDEAVRKRSVRRYEQMPSIGFFRFKPGAIPVEPARTVTCSLCI